MKKKFSLFNDEVGRKRIEVSDRPPSTPIDKIIERLEEIKAKSRYERDTALVASQEVRDNARMVAFYYGRNVGNNTTIIRELGQNPVPSKGISNSHIPPSREVQYARTNSGGSSVNYTPRTPRPNPKKPVLIVPVVYPFKTAQKVYDWNDQGNKTYIVKSGDNKNKVFNLQADVKGLINLSSKPNDFLILLQRGSIYYGLGVNDNKELDTIWTIDNLEFDYLFNALNWYGGKCLFSDFIYEFNPKEKDDNSEEDLNSLLVTGEFTANNRNYAINFNCPYSSLETNASNTEIYAEEYVDNDPDKRLLSYKQDGWLTSSYVQLVEITENTKKNGHYAFIFDGINLNENPDIYYKTAVNSSYSENFTFHWFYITEDENTYYSGRYNSSSSFEKIVKYPIWVDKNRKFCHIEDDYLMTLSASFDGSCNPGNSFAYPTIDLFSQFHTGYLQEPEHQRNITLQWRSMPCSYDVILMRRDSEVSLYRKNNDIGDYSISYYGIVSGLSINPYSINRSIDFSQVILDPLIHTNEVPFPPFQHIIKTNYSRLISGDGTHPDFVEQNQGSRLGSINEEIEYYIGDQKLNFNNTYCFDWTEIIELPEQLELPYSFEISNENYNYINYLKDVQLDIISAVTETITPDYNTGYFYNRIYTKESDAVSRGIWNSISDSACYVIIYDIVLEKYRLFEGNQSTSYSIYSTTIENVTLESIDLGDTITSNITLTREIRKFDGISFLDITPYYMVVFSKENLLHFIIEYMAKYPRYINWTEDNYIFGTCGIKDFSYKYDINKLAEVFPIYFDGENFVLKEELFFKKKPDPTVSKAFAPVTENKLITSTFIHYSWDSKEV
jgi:hypothetical protein